MQYPTLKLKTPTCHFPSTFFSTYPWFIWHKPKYLNSEMWSKCLPSTITSHTDLYSLPNTIISYLFAFDFRSFSLHTSAKRPVLLCTIKSPHNGCKPPLCIHIIQSQNTPLQSFAYSLSHRELPSSIFYSVVTFLLPYLPLFRTIFSFHLHSFHAQFQLIIQK